MSIPFSVDSLGKSIPIWLCDLNSSLWNTLDGVNFVTKYLPGENKLVVHTDRLGDEPLETVKTMAESYMPDGSMLVQYNHHIEVSWRDINKYANCTDVADMKAVNPNYQKDLTSDGEWVYPLTNLKNANDLFRRGGPYKKIDLFLPNATNCRYLLAWDTCDDITLDLPKLSATDNMLRDATINVLKIKIPKTLTSIYQMMSGYGAAEIYGNFEHVKYAEFAFNRLNHKILRVLDSDWSSLSYGKDMFERSTIHKDVALRVLTTIPSYTSGNHPLTMGIHVDHKTDEEVLSAIDAATAKGWTLTVQWNGTPTSGVSTLDLDDIYAKVNVLDDEHAQYGEYSDENGNRCSLDWGHIITSPDGKTPEEMDYVCFYSLYEAEEYFNLTKVEADPSEDKPTETNN